MNLFKFDPSQLTVGQSVSTLVDTSGNGNDLSQTVLARQPTIGESEGRVCVKFTGSQFLSRTSVNFTGLTELVVTIACKYYGTSASCILEHGIGPYTGVGWGVYANNARATLGGGVGHGSTAYKFFNAEQTDLVGKPTLITLIYRPGTSLPINIRINGVDSPEILAAGAGTPNTSLFTNLPLYMGARTGTSTFANIEIYGAVASNTVDDIVVNEEWCTSLLPPIPAPVTFYRTPKNGSSFHQNTYTTTATVLELEIESTIAGSHPSFAQIGVKVDGVNYTPITVANGLTTRQVLLPAGNKVVTITDGPQSKPSALLGTWLRSIKANAPLMSPQTDTLVVYGDSIASGDAAGPVQTSAWTMILRDSVGYPVNVIAHGWRSLNEDCSTDTAIASFVNKIADISPSRVWLAIGTNDCGLSKWSAESFGLAYGKLLDALHMQIPWAVIYAQSPTIRTDFPSISLFRSQIINQCATRPWAEYIDGLSILDSSDLSDNVHPSTIGHSKYTTKVLSHL